MQSDSVKTIIEQHFTQVLNKFKKLSTIYSEPPSDFDGILWNKLKTLKTDGKLNTDYKKILLSDQSTRLILSLNTLKMSDKIIVWSEKNYFNSTLVINYLIKLGEYQLTKNLIESNEIIVWAQTLSSSFYKQLTQYTFDEKIIRSFIYGRPFNFTYSLNNSTVVTYMNFRYYPVFFAKSQSKATETLTNLSNEMIFYMNYSEIDDPNIIGGSFEYKLNVNILSQIDAKWLTPAVPLFFNPMIVPDIIKKVGIYDDIVSVDYPIAHSIQKLKKDMINNWDINMLIWNNSVTPILQHFYKAIGRHISARIKN